MKKEMIKKAIIGTLGVASIITIGGSMAYFTDQESTINNFSVGEVAVELHEDQWDELLDTNGNGIPDVAENITPTLQITKDPSVKNVGKDPAYAYLKITVPYKNLITANADGSRKAKDYVELYSFTKKEGWTQLSKTINEDKTAVEYVFYYNKVLEVGEQSSTLFDTVITTNFIEGQIDGTKLQMPVEAIAIQITNVGSQAEAYTKYLNQNK